MTDIQTALFVAGYIIMAVAAGFAVRQLNFDGEFVLLMAILWPTTLLFGLGILLGKVVFWIIERVTK